MRSIDHTSWHNITTSCHRTAVQHPHARKAGLERISTQSLPSTDTIYRRPWPSGAVSLASSTSTMHHSLLSAAGYSAVVSGNSIDAGVSGPCRYVGVRLRAGSPWRIAVRRPRYSVADRSRFAICLGIILKVSLRGTVVSRGPYMRGRR